MRLSLWQPQQKEVNRISKHQPVNPHKQKFFLFIVVVSLWKYVVDKIIIRFPDATDFIPDMVKIYDFVVH